MTEGQHPLRFNWRSFGLWVGLTTVGFILARPLIHVQADGTTASFNLRDLNLSAAAVGFLFGCVTGVIIASLQWLSLRSWAPSAHLWIPLNAIGFGLEHAFDDGLPYLPPFDQTAILVIGGIAFVFGSAGLTSRAVTGMVTKLMVSDRTALSGRQLKPEKTNSGQNKPNIAVSFIRSNGQRRNRMSGLPILLFPTTGRRTGKARGLTDADIIGKPAEFAMPNILIRLPLDHDQMFTF